MKIAVVGLGYVGLSVAVLLSTKYNVIATDIDESKVDAVNSGRSPIEDADISQHLNSGKLSLKATTNVKLALQNADYIIIATPTNYDPKTNKFNTSSVDSVILSAIAINTQATIVIKSTIPVGFTEQSRKRYNFHSIIFSPEFLREGKALYDNLHPSRIIVGDRGKKGEEFANLLASCAVEQYPPILLTDSNEAEAIKLFSNTYLAMRIAYFNELDSYAESHDLDSKRIIDGISLDPRIGNHYNNPSFGYGGYCLPKDTKQLLANYQEVPNNLIGAIVESNTTRKNFITASILSKHPKTVGVYRLIMKNGSDNFRDSSVLDIIRNLTSSNIELVIYEPSIADNEFMGIRIEKNLGHFKEISSLIIANRTSSDLDDVLPKVYSRDIFKNN